LVLGAHFFINTGHVVVFYIVQFGFKYFLLSLIDLHGCFLCQNLFSIVVNNAIIKGSPLLFSSAIAVLDVENDQSSIFTRSEK
jgi:hypothetical protein